MSKEQAAAYAGCATVSAFNNWIRRGIMPVFRDGGRCADVMLELFFAIYAFVSERREKAHCPEQHIERSFARRCHLTLAVRARPVRHIGLPAGSRSFTTAHFFETFSKSQAAS
jgi:hypothetical protein